MTTPTREQVVQWAIKAGINVGLNDASPYPTVDHLKKVITLARADLEAELESLRKDAELWKFAVRKGLITIHSERMVDRDQGTRCSWIQGHDKAADINNDYAAAPKEKGE